MEIVMPRAFSSGALSIWSKGVNAVVGLWSWRTLVIAAVSVVLPWSMCPIVPMLTWGLLRSNFCFAISADCSVSRGALGPGSLFRLWEPTDAEHCCSLVETTNPGSDRLLAGRPGDDLPG